MQNKHEIWELRQMQALPLEAKVTMTKHRIQMWIDEFGRMEGDGFAEGSSYGNRAYFSYGFAQGFDI